MSSEFQTQIQPQRPGRFSNASQRRAPINRWVKKKAEIENPSEHAEFINYTLDGLSIHQVTTKKQASFLTQLPERKETAEGFPHEANGVFKTVTEFKGCDRRKLQIDQQHCSYSTILTNESKKKEACTEFFLNSKTCILFAIRQKWQKEKWQSNELYVLNKKHYVWGKSNDTLLSTTLHIFKNGGGCIMLWLCLSSARTKEIFRIKSNRIELRTSKILKETLVLYPFQQTLGNKSTFQQDNNLKHKAKYTLELLTKMTLNVAEWPSYS